MKADWDHLKVVLAINRGGSLTAAATLLGMDQTTAGRRLNALEESLGNALFLRSKGGFAATEAGQIVIENAQRVEARLDQMRETLDDIHDGVSGVLRLTGNNWMLQRLAERILPDFLGAFPRIEMRLSGRLPPSPIYSEPTVSLWFDALPLATDIATPLCSIAYATYQAKGAKQDNAQWVQFQDDIAQGPSFSRQLRQRMTSDDKMRMTATDAQILQAAVRSGLGRGVLPICLGDKDPALERVADTATINRVLHFHASKDARELKRVQIFQEHLASKAHIAFEGELIGSRKKKVRK